MKVNKFIIIIIISIILLLLFIIIIVRENRAGAKDRGRRLISTFLP